MIRTIKDKETRKVWEREFSGKFQAIQRAALIRMEALNMAKALADLKLPGYRLEALRGDRKGQYSVRVNDQYRICFFWRNGHAEDVEIADYH